MSAQVKIQKSCFCSKVKIDRWPYSMQNKFGMDKIQGSHKLEWLFVLFLVRIYFTSSKKVTDYLWVKGIGCVFKQKNILWMKTNDYPNKITFYLVTVVPVTSFTLKSTSKLRSFLHFRYSIVIPRFIPHANKAQL